MFLLFPCFYGLKILILSLSAMAHGQQLTSFVRLLASLLHTPHVMCKNQGPSFDMLTGKASSNEEIDGNELKTPLFARGETN